jgi:hypothetical protein
MRETKNYWVIEPCPSSGILRKQKTERFGNWIYFRPQVRGDIYSVGSLKKSSPEDENKSSFRNVVFSSF